MSLRLCMSRLTPSVIGSIGSYWSFEAALPSLLWIHPLAGCEAWLDSVWMLPQGNGCCLIVSDYRRSWEWWHWMLREEPRRLQGPSCVRLWISTLHRSQWPRDLLVLSQGKLGISSMQYKRLLYRSHDPSIVSPDQYRIAVVPCCISRKVWLNYDVDGVCCCLVIESHPHLQYQSVIWYADTGKQCSIHHVELCDREDDSCKTLYVLYTAMTVVYSIEFRDGQRPLVSRQKVYNITQYFWFLD